MTDPTPSANAKDVALRRRAFDPTSTIHVIIDKLDAPGFRENTQLIFLTDGTFLGTVGSGEGRRGRTGRPRTLWYVRGQPWGTDFDSRADAIRSLLREHDYAGTP